MPLKFKPNFIISANIARNLMRIEAAKEQVAQYSLTSKILSSLRETARLYTTHYSTMIEGNRLGVQQIKAVLHKDSHFVGKERDEREVKGYYAALMYVETLAEQDNIITEKIIQTLHALVMAEGKIKVKPTPYRDGQNVIRDGITGAIVYMPPEAKDVPQLMHALINWIKESHDLPCPIVAAIAHYQFATIHPYYDGNGRTARLLTTLVLHVGNYGLKGIYSLEEYYARDLGAYYEAISIGESHNYYMGRADADITKWIEYFIEGMAVACENIAKSMAQLSSTETSDQSQLLRSLDPRQRKALSLFRKHATVTSKQIGQLFGFQPRTSAHICKEWVESSFLEVVDFSKKGRKYKLSDRYVTIL